MLNQIWENLHIPRNQKDYYPQQVIRTRYGEVILPAYFSNAGYSAQQLFSDRFFACLPCPGQPPNFATQPFSQSDVDNLGITIRAPPILSTSPAPTVTFTLLSWGGAQFTFQADCIAGLIYVIWSDSVQLISLRNVRQKAIIK